MQSSVVHKVSAILRSIFLNKLDAISTGGLRWQIPYSSLSAIVVAVPWISPYRRRQFGKPALVDPTRLRFG